MSEKTRFPNTVFGTGIVSEEKQFALPVLLSSATQSLCHRLFQFCFSGALHKTPLIASHGPVNLTIAL